MNSTEVIWQVKAEDRYFEAEFNELVQWISEGALIPEDLVTHSNLRWLEAGKVPGLQEHFREFERNREIGPPPDAQEIYTNFQVDHVEDGAKPLPRVSRYTSGTLNSSNNLVNQDLNLDETEQEVCVLHSDKPTFYYCGICLNCFCKECPNTFGTVKLCPLCGAMCELYDGQLLHATHGAINKPYKRAKLAPVVEEEPVEQGLTLNDLMGAIRFPFRFPLSLAVGFLLFSVLGIGIGGVLIGQPIMYLIGLISLVLVIMLQFGEFSKTLENLLQNDIHSSYMPHLNKYSFIEDFVRPFFMGGAVYLVSFGLFITIGCGTTVLVKLHFLNQQNEAEAEMRNANNKIDFALAKQRAENAAGNVENQSKANIDEMVDQSKENQEFSVFGDHYLGDNANVTRLVASFLRLSVYYQMPLCFSFIFGVFYFPIACSIAGSTRSIRKILNPILGIKTIRKLGFDYIKILCLFLLLTMLSLGIGIGIFLGFSNFNLPMVGIFSTIITATLLMSYSWVVYSEFMGRSVSNKLILQSNL